MHAQQDELTDNLSVCLSISLCMKHRMPRSSDAESAFAAALMTSASNEKAAASRSSQCTLTAYCTDCCR